MMSPLSLAKFLKPSEVEFDLLVIDEASQMRPEDALGGMLRTRQIVVVGDPKQLPPTDFFMRSADETSLDDEFEDVDAESILEACHRTFREIRPLKWHYRSRCESLIAFSNAEFYNGSLITFPTARPGSFAIDLIRVDGAYQARRNVAEAICVAEEAVQFMRRFAEMDEKTVPSLGLVAVNTDQRDVIQEELRRLSAGDQLVDIYREKVQKKGEPLFVKNLENVQGDERDYIFISLTYGREPGATAMKQRFGPINGKQGHRRLNVLFSRARIRIGLFASFGSADVKPSETSSEGVHVLKRYLEYAESRGRAIVETIGSEPDSDFEVEVAARLRARGYQVDAQVGVSGYKIDLGIRHPDHPEHFLAGVECDGARYHSSKSARDRDRLREEVLRGLGWELLRVWSTDWFDNPDLETEKLAKRLQQLQSQPAHPFGDYRLVREVVSPEHEMIAEWSPAAVITDDPTTPVPVTEIAPSAVTPMPESGVARETTLIAGKSPLTEEQAFEALKKLRETVIRPQFPTWEPHRSILRDGMIETFVSSMLDGSR
jgi:very-short-patch-repair endonuclease